MARAAAVLAQFDPDHLNPVDGPASDADFRSMLSDSVVLKDSRGSPVWSLRLDVRQKVLLDLGGGEYAGAEQADHGEQDDCSELECESRDAVHVPVSPFLQWCRGVEP